MFEIQCTHPRFFRWVTSVMFAATLCGGASAEEIVQPSVQRDLANVLANQAVRRNPSIASIRHRLTALEHRVHRAGAWFDPKVAVEYSNMPVDSWIPGNHPMSGIQLTLQQTFMYPGKTERRQAEAKGYVRQTTESLAEAKVQLRAAVMRAYYQLARVRNLRRVTKRHVKLVKRFADVVRAKYVVGKAGQHDMIRLQLLADKLADDVRDFDRDDRASLAAINATLHRSSDTPVETPHRLALVGAPDGLTALSKTIEKSRPSVRLQREIAKTHRAVARRAEQDGYPDFTAWIGYRVRVASDTDRGTDFVGFGLSLPIPMFSRRRFNSEASAHRAMADQAEATRVAMVDTIRGALVGAASGWRRAAEKVEIYRKKLMPGAQRALEATFAAYQVDRADFASLYQAQVQLLEFERAIIGAETDIHLHKVDVEALVGARQTRSGR